MAGNLPDAPNPRNRSVRGRTCPRLARRRGGGYHRAMAIDPHIASRPSRRPARTDEVIYPDSDGKPLAEDTLQLDWIMLLKANLDLMVDDFVAGDLLWYPVEGQPKVRLAPDVMVALGRPKGYRGSYRQWVEDDVAPQVVIEVMSPSNDAAEMIRKALFYHRHGANEFIVIDPEAERGWGYVRDADGEFSEVSELHGWTSPSLGIRFERVDGALKVFHPNGEPFRDHFELAARADQEAARAEQEAARADREAARAERLAARLAALGETLDD